MGWPVFVVSIQAFVRDVIDFFFTIINLSNIRVHVLSSFPINLKALVEHSTLRLPKCERDSIF